MVLNAVLEFVATLACCESRKSVCVQVVMANPVIAADGHTYEHSAIQHWLQGSSTSPVTREKLPHTRLVPNVLVKSALAQHAQLSWVTAMTEPCSSLCGRCLQVVALSLLG